MSQHKNDDPLINATVRILSEGALTTKRKIEDMEDDLKSMAADLDDYFPEKFKGEGSKDLVKKLLDAARALHTVSQHRHVALLDSEM